MIICGQLCACGRLKINHLNEWFLHQVKLGQYQPKRFLTNLIVEINIRVFDSETLGESEFS